MLEARPVVAGEEGDSVLFSDRFSAFVIDLLILGGLQIVASFVLSRVLQAAGMRTVGPCAEDELVLCEGPSTAAWLVVAVAFVAVTVGYHAWFEGTLGATPGKRFAGIAVADADAATEPIGIGRATVRSLLRQSFWWALLVVFATSSSTDTSTVLTVWFVAGLAAGLASLISAAVSPSGRSLHDIAARSRVGYVMAPHDSLGPNDDDDDDDAASPSDSTRGTTELTDEEEDEEE